MTTSPVPSSAPHQPALAQVSQLRQQAHEAARWQQQLRDRAPWHSWTGPAAGAFAQSLDVVVGGLGLLARRLGDTAEALQHHDRVAAARAERLSQLIVGR
ncbi:hypothetical protein BH10ACT8_BH10ACT8_21460 [soil metagenome]|jgi:hypothetical protein